MLSIFLKSQIGDWSDCAWWSPQYDELYSEQAATIDPAQRKTLIDEMQQIVYEQSPYVILAYPKGLEAENTSRWEGWVQSPSGTGSAIFSVDNTASYLFVHPKAGAMAPKKSAAALLPIVLGAAALVVIVVIVVFVRRSRGRVEEQG